MKREVIAHQDPKSPISEIFRTLRTNIQFMNSKGKLKTLLVTSTMPNEGKSWVSANLAVTFAQAGKKVVLMDADMRKGRQYSIFGVSPKPGLSNYLSGVDSNIDEESVDDLANYIQETDVENLYLMPAGNIPPNPSELLITPQMVSLLDDLKEICDIVIIDSTPSQLITDSLILTRLVDSTLIVTASRETKKEDLKRIINNIQNVGGKIAGIVVNKMSVSTKKYSESYYYGSTSVGKLRPQSNKVNKKGFNKTTDFIKTADLSKEKTKSVEEKNDDKQVPTALKNNLRIEGTDQISEEKTNEILKQINNFLDKGNEK